MRIGIFDTRTLNQIGHLYKTHDQANQALTLMTEQKVISTDHLEVADIAEIEFRRAQREVAATAPRKRTKLKAVKG